MSLLLYYYYGSVSSILCDTGVQIKRQQLNISNNSR